MKKKTRKPSGCIAAAGYPLLIVGAIIMLLSLVSVIIELVTLNEPDGPYRAEEVQPIDTTGLKRLPSGDWYEVDSLSGDTIVTEPYNPYAYYPSKHGRATIGLLIGVVVCMAGAFPFSIGLIMVIYYNSRSRKAWLEEQLEKRLEEERQRDASATETTE